MRQILPLILIAFLVAAPVFAVSGFSVTLGEATSSNPSYKSAVMDYFKAKTDKDLQSADIKIVTASEVNEVSRGVTGHVYAPSQILSCAMVDLSYSDGIKVSVDTSKIRVVTPEMYASALRSSGIDRGYVVVTSPVPASGEAALAGVLKSYEIAVGEQIPEEAKRVSVEEIYLQSRLVNETNATGDRVAELFDEVKNRTQSQNLQDPADIQRVVVDVSQQMNINLTETQVQQVADSVAASQRVQGSLTEFKQRLEGVSQQVGGSGILDQIYAFLQSIYNYIMGIASP
ncbi:DUF1002 domain-containing protein [Methanothermobacter thermautotrophicus]|uniref:DUF1002 domain-containing protein n=1 Tax=Methanothermobacter thermautotrophicus TaxID=145262 RepID=UPI0022B9417D|nr:DUF1002 domain-containing protein [Methanothermobacter thermautotrophicus]WBF07393.1 DUF1002 domain-containing protein [Methanothermobacter thermautotrophicus]